MRECVAQVSTAQTSSAQPAAAQSFSAHVEWLKWEKWLVAQVSAANLYITPSRLSPSSLPTRGGYGAPYDLGSSRIRGLSRENPPRDQRSKSKNLRDLFSISVSLRDLLRASVSVREPFPASSKDFSTFELVLVEKQLLLREYSLASLVVLPPFRLTHSSTLSLTHVVSSLT